MSDIRERSSKFLTESIDAATGGQGSEAVAAQLEQAIFEKHGESTNAYRAEVRNYGLTLKKDNPQLASDLISGRVAPAQLAKMPFEDMKTKEQAKQDAQLRQQNFEASVGVDGLYPEPGAITTADEADMYTYGEAGDATLGGGGEGEFKARAQPKVGEAMRGIEFETGV